MKKFAIATTLSILLASSAFAAETSAPANQDRIAVFPPITQTLGYTFSAPLIKLPTNPANGNLAQVSPPITQLIGTTYDRPLHPAVH